MKVLRTPDDRFRDLPGFSFEPHYAEIADGELRVHFLDEGPAEAPPVLLMHGEPSWCFLYRSMIGPLVDAGHRVICPDLVGFGRSDKPAEQSDYTFARHVGWMAELLFDQLDVRGITLFGQDWGGLVGLRLVGADPDRFARWVIADPTTPSWRGSAIHGNPPRSTSARSSVGAASIHSPPRWWRPTTRPSPMTPTRPGRASSRR